jgi:transketolase C-terminal domain/subunit
VAEQLAENGSVPIRRINIRDSFVETGEMADLLTKYETRAEDIVRAALEVVARKGETRV